MSINLYLLGGSGRIGRALVDSLVAEPVKNLQAIHIYCDSTKAFDLQSLYDSSTSSPLVKVSGYSAFDTLSGARRLGPDSSNVDKHLVWNLRGINNKQQWLNQPLDSLELHCESSRALVNADLWMLPGSEIFHLSSLLCDLIEGPYSLDDICEGQESYRRPYLVSRLHQEEILASNAYQHSICTSLLRMPAIYGFDDDHESPWVLNSLCKLKLAGQKVKPRYPERAIHLCHKDLLISWIRALIVESTSVEKPRTVNYLRPPMLRMSVMSLATLVQESPRTLSPEEIARLQITLQGDTEISESVLDSHLASLTISISEILSGSR